MNWSFQIARINGIAIKVHITFFLIVFLSALQWSDIGGGLAGAAFGVALIVLLFVCVTLHELGHSLLAQRFGIPVRLNFYSIEELELVVSRGARVLGAAISPDGAREIARRSRGTPRIAGRLLRRVRDFATVDASAIINAAVADKALKMP